MIVFLVPVTMERFFFVCLSVLVGWLPDDPREPKDQQRDDDGAHSTRFSGGDEGWLMYGGPPRENRQWLRHKGCGNNDFSTFVSYLIYLSLHYILPH